MSRIGKKPVAVPPKVKVTLADGAVTIEGPKGKISREFRREVAIKFLDSGKEPGKDGPGKDSPGKDSTAKQLPGMQIIVERTSDEPFARAYHGTSRAHLANMVHGVSEGFHRALSIVGVGYNAKLQGRKLVLQVGFSHPVEMQIPEGLNVEIPQPTHVVVRGVDRQMVGEFAARIRKVRPPEPYKGKGIRYEDERIVKKAGKAFGSSE